MNATQKMSQALDQFKNLEIVAKSLNIIHSSISVSEVITKWPNFVRPSKGEPRQNEKMLYVQWLAKVIADHYGIRDTTFIVLINPYLDTVAQVEVRNATDIFVEYRGTESSDSAALTAILAHEIAHIFLHRHRLEVKDTFHNEALTDTTTIYLGFGRNYLNAQQTTTEYLGEHSSRTTTHKYGYLSPEEMGYVLAVRDRLRGENSKPFITTNLGLAGYCAGEKKLNTRLSVRPYVQRGIISRIMSRLGWFRSDEATSIEFPCWICSQQMRIPSLKKKVLAACPHCNAKLLCYS